ncbi:protein misato homolog 1 isoform X2 [Ambystoma mexicanum]|uniref:protein misato homolog 1 isoform X2 n=1 Tax=Ambystoma mexicanum TaxID=8296 RepID=UPI0037E9BE44
MAHAHREVLTLQLGHYASCVGTHWWNLQDAALRYNSETKQPDPEICYDVMFRAGVTSRGQETYTPRLILMDLKGSLNSLKQDGSLYTEEKNTSPAGAWQGIVTIHQEDRPIKNPFLQDLTAFEGDGFNDWVLDTRSSNEARRVPWEPSSKNKEPDRSNDRFEGKPLDVSGKVYQLEGRVHVWSDYLRFDMHPKTVFTVHRYQHEGTSDRLEAFGQGTSLLDDPAYLEELEDRLHFFVEECDSLQGFQVLCDLHDGFSGVGSKVTEILHDEYPGKGILTWGTSPAVHTEKSPVKQVYRLLNSVLGIVALSTHSSLYCPLSLSGSLGRQPGPLAAFPRLLYDASLNYHSSAVLATALETISIPYRLQNSAFTMGQLADGLNFSGRKVVTAWASVPFPIRQSSSLADAFCSNPGAAPWEALSCVQQKESQCFAQSVVLRGIGRQCLSSHSHHRNTGPGGIYQTQEDLLEEFLHYLYPETLSASHVVQSPCRVGPPYPQFFSPDTNCNGFINDQPYSIPAVVESIPVLTAMQSSSVMQSTLRGLCNEVSKLDVRRWDSYFTGGLEQEEYHEALQELRTLAQCYKGSIDLAEDDSD